MDDLTKPATANLDGGTITSMAEEEGWPVEDYVISLANHLRTNNAPLSNQRERLQALAGCGAGADLAAAETLAQHQLILEALFQRFSVEAIKWSERTESPRNSEVVERFLNAAVKAQGAAARCMSALKVLRDSPSASTPTTPTSGD